MDIHEDYCLLGNGSVTPDIAKSKEIIIHDIKVISDGGQV